MRSSDQETSTVSVAQIWQCTCLREYASAAGQGRFFQTSFDKSFLEMSGAGVRVLIPIEHEHYRMNALD